MVAITFINFIYFSGVQFLFRVALGDHNKIKINRKEENKIIAPTIKKEKEKH